ncbi:SHOCT domain-containing protein [Patescibacteria group bacterium]|nr:SHOCT domain-containing protein [Patescibacteria group bacterium]
MKKLFGGIVISALVLMLHGSASAAAAPTPTQTAQDPETAGLQLLQQLQSGQRSCANLSQNDFDLLGDYFMGQMMGNYHETMDSIMQQNLGDAGDTAMHVAMGERFSGCNTAATLPFSGNNGFYPMVEMMNGAYANSAANGYGMMGSSYAPTAYPAGKGMMGDWGYEWSWFSWIWVVLWYALAVVLVILGIRWLRKSHLIGGHHSSMEILKERYAKGELTKEHFEEMRKELLR